MTHQLRRLALGAMGAALLIAQAAAAATDAEISAAAGRGASWLISFQHDDGSWGPDDIAKLLLTAETVQAFRALDLLGPSYQRGITWLENHNAPNSDLAARRLAALTPHNDTLNRDWYGLYLSKVSGAPAGWGLTARYHADPLDTALALQSLALSNSTVFTSDADAITGLRTSAVTSTWTIGQPEFVLPFEGDLMTTVAVAKTFRACAATGASACADLSLLTPMEALFLSYSYSTSLERALITGYFTPLRGTPPPPVSAAAILSMVDVLLGAQSTLDGSWDGDVLTTATAIHALASWLGLDRANASVVVPISRAGLRGAVNRSLGNPTMDAVTKGDLWRLTTLDLSYASTGSDLRSIRPDAQNITTIDISGNACLLAISDPTDTLLHSWFSHLTTVIKHPLGDVNQDDNVNAFDERLVVAHLLNRLSLPALRQRAADLTLDGRLDARDLYWLDRILLKRDVSQLCQ